MDRRGFLQNAMLAAAALAIDPERLLWTPGKRISIPAPRMVTIRLGLPAPWGRMINNQGIVPSKSTTFQITEEEYRRRYPELGVTGQRPLEMWCYEGTEEGVVVMTRSIVDESASPSFPHVLIAESHKQQR